MNELVVTLAMVATAVDPERKRQAYKAKAKCAHNQARYLVNLVAESAGKDLNKLTAVQILQAALLVAESQQP